MFLPVPARPTHASKHAEVGSVGHRTTFGNSPFGLASDAADQRMDFHQVSISVHQGWRASCAMVDFQFRDIRGKAATDTSNLAHSQKLLGHNMTEHYVKVRMGERVKPLRQ